MESKYRQRGGSMQGITSFVLVSAATILLWPGTVSGQRVITGTITDSGGARIPYATVEQGARRTVADDSGRFRFSVNSGRGFLYVRRIGYRRADLAYDAGGDTTIVVVLTPVARQLEGQVIEAVQISRALELRGFYRRLHDRQNGTNAGQFITAEEIEQRNPHRISQMFDGRTGIRMQRPNQNPGMSRRQTASDTKCTSAADPRCWAPVGLNGCYMDVYFDGRRLSSISLTNEPTYVDEYILPTHVAGIEIYTTAGKVPPEYQSLSGTCGVILLWSK